MTVINLLLNFLVASTIAVITTPHPEHKASLSVARRLQTLQEGAVAMQVQIVNLHCRDDFESSDERTDFQFKRRNHDKMEVLGHQAVCKKTHFFLLTALNEAVYDTVADFSTRKDGQILVAVDSDESSAPVMVVMPKPGHARRLTLIVEISIFFAEQRRKFDSHDVFDGKT